MTAQRLNFLKGHGTGNDFVLLPDEHGTLDVTPGLVAALCDRRFGIGADGVIRIARDGARTFVMDYWNADGSVAEMCGNASRVFARYLVEAGWITPGRVDFTVWGRPHWAELGTSGQVAVGMGPVRWGEMSSATVRGVDYRGLVIDVGNPHLACLTDDDLSGFDLTGPPGIDPDVFPNGANVELVRVLDDRHIAMRVHERGVGETLSCGTGTVAAAIAHLHAAGRHKGRVQVAVPGGAVTVGISAHPHGPQATIIGPAELVASGTVRLDALPL